MPVLPPLALYIHIPWCIRKCPYCDFNSHRAGADLPETDYVAVLLRDLDTELSGVEGRTVDTLFIGGGTPSLMAAETIDALLAGVRARIPVSADAEITLEANPGAADQARFEGYRQAGVNRLSIGIQSFDDAMLQRLGRVHDRPAALAAVAAARAAGFSNLNLDLMFGLPGQTLAGAMEDMTTALQLEPTHLSFYQLTLEPNTAFYKYPPALPDPDAAWAIQQQGQTLLAGAGFRQYEVSAWCRDDALCRHNLNYWQFGDYIGIGAGAHGKITFVDDGFRVIRTARIKHPDHYLAKTPGSPASGTRLPVPAAELPFEFLMNAWRLREGFDCTLFEARTGQPLASVESRLDGCIRAGLIEHHGDNLRCTAHGFNFLDTVLQRFLP